jgi:hypothetical protein
MNRLKFDEMKRARKDANLIERQCWSLKEDLLLISILNLSIGNTVLLRGMRMDSLKMLKCIISSDYIKSLITMHHLNILLHNFSRSTWENLPSSMGQIISSGHTT